MKYFTPLITTRVTVNIGQYAFLRCREEELENEGKE
jgi:hypothetical protein